MKEELEIAWNQYSLLVDLYKFYFNLALQASIFSYGITGAILAFYFKNSDIKYITISLILPLIFNLLLCFISTIGISLMRPITNRIRLLAIETLGLEVFPVTSPLTIFLKISSLAYLGVSIVIAILLFQHS